MIDKTQEPNKDLTFTTKNDDLPIEETSPDTLKDIKFQSISYLENKTGNNVINDIINEKDLKDFKNKEYEKPANNDKIESFILQETDYFGNDIPNYGLETLIDNEIQQEYDFKDIIQDKKSINTVHDENNYKENSRHENLLNIINEKQNELLEENKNNNLTENDDNIFCDESSFKNSFNVLEESINTDKTTLITNTMNLSTQVVTEKGIHKGKAPIDSLIVNKRAGKSIHNKQNLLNKILEGSPSIKHGNRRKSSLNSSTVLNALYNEPNNGKMEQEKKQPANQQKRKSLVINSKFQESSTVQNINNQFDDAYEDNIIKKGKRNSIQRIKREINESNGIIEKENQNKIENKPNKRNYVSLLKKKPKKSEINETMNLSFFSNQSLKNIINSYYGDNQEKSEENNIQNLLNGIKMRIDGFYKILGIKPSQNDIIKMLDNLLRHCNARINLLSDESKEIFQGKFQYKEELVSVHIEDTKVDHNANRLENIDSIKNINEIKIKTENNKSAFEYPKEINNTDANCKKTDKNNLDVNLNERNIELKNAIYLKTLKCDVQEKDKIIENLKREKKIEQQESMKREYNLRKENSDLLNTIEIKETLLQALEEKIKDEEQKHPIFDQSGLFESIEKVGKLHKIKSEELSKEIETLRSDVIKYKKENIQLEYKIGDLEVVIDGLTCKLRKEKVIMVDEATLME